MVFITLHYREEPYMDQNLSLYHIFYTVANAGTISKAAKELYISQPAISKAIQKLEHSLEVSLFTRTSRGVHLTNEGKILYTHVRTAVDALSAGEDQMRRIHNLGMGQLHIGASTTLCRYVLLPYLQGFVKNHPHIQISIDCQPTHQILGELESGKVDVGLVGCPKKTGSSFSFFSLGSIQDTFVATPSYLENLQKRDSASATYMLLNQENVSRQYIDSYLSDMALPVEHILEVTTMDLLIDFARTGLGIACVIREFVNKELEDGTLIEVPLQVTFPRREVGLLYQEHNTTGFALNSFLRYIKECTANKREEL